MRIWIVKEVSPKSFWELICQPIMPIFQNNFQFLSKKSQFFVNIFLFAHAFKLAQKLLILRWFCKTEIAERRKINYKSAHNHNLEENCFRRFSCLQNLIFIKTWQQLELFDELSGFKLKFCICRKKLQQNYWLAFYWLKWFFISLLVNMIGSSIGNNYLLWLFELSSYWLCFLYSVWFYSLCHLLMIFWGGSWPSGLSAQINW